MNGVRGFSLGNYCSVFFCLLGGLAFCPGAIAQDYSFDEVESVFIEHLVNYIEWPQSSFSSSLDPFVISVLGRSPLVSELKKIMSQKTMSGKKIIIRNGDEPEQLEKSQVVVVLGDDLNLLDQTLKKIKGLNVLLISRSEGFCQHGVMINFYVESSRLRFEVNLTALQNANLKVSSQLLKLARIVQP